MVFDGDNVYLYVKEEKGYNASNVGSNHNGKFAITTDLGNTLIVQLNQDGTVSGANGATCSHVSSMYGTALVE